MGTSPRSPPITNNPLLQSSVATTSDLVPLQFNSDEDGPRSVVVLSGEALVCIKQIPDVITLLEQIRDLLLQLNT